MAIVFEAAVVTGSATTVADQGDVHRVIPAIGDQVPGLHGPVRREGVLDAAAYGMAHCGAAVAARNLKQSARHIRAEEVDAVLDIRIGETAGRVKQGAIPGIADTAAHGAEKVHARTEGIVE